MAKERSPERDTTRRAWLESGGTLTPKQLAEQFGVRAEQVRKWKSLDNWQAELESKKPKRKRGGQPGNKNAVGAGAPAGNKNAETHGAYSTVRLCDLPQEQREYIEGITLDTETNMLAELQTLIAKETDLQNKIAELERADSGALYVDRVVEMRKETNQTAGKEAGSPATGRRFPDLGHGRERRQETDQTTGKETGSPTTRDCRLAGHHRRQGTRP